MLDDGSYEAVVVDATEDGDVVVLDLAVLSGPHKGDVVSVRATALEQDPLDLLALPATLIVAGGQPSVHLDD